MIRHEKVAQYTEDAGTEVVVKLGTSPGGKPCVQLEKGGELWILHSTMYRDEAPDQLIEYLKLGITSMFGLPVDWRASIRDGVIWEFAQGETERPVVGIYIPAGEFDGFVEKGMRPLR